MYTIIMKTTTDQTITVDFEGTLDQAKATAVRICESGKYPPVSRILITTTPTETDPEPQMIAVWETQ